MATGMEEQYDKIYRYCYFRLHDRGRAEDITQEAFLRMLERYPDVAQAGGWNKALPLLYTIARNLCIDEYRKPHPEYGEWEAFEVMASSGENAEVQSEEQSLLRYAVSVALGKLQPEERELLLLRYVNEVPVGVIAKVLQMSRFAVYRRVEQAKRRLREELGKEGIYEA